MRTFTKRQGGFTLVELVIIIVVIGVLTAVAVPRFMRNPVKSKQDVVKQVLKRIHKSETDYRSIYKTYWGQNKIASSVAPNSMDIIGIRISPNDPYIYSIEYASADSLVVTAESGVLDGDDKVDSWIINQNGDIECISDDAIQ